MPDSMMKMKLELIDSGTVPTDGSCHEWVPKNSVPFPVKLTPKLAGISTKSKCKTPSIIRAKFLSQISPAKSESHLISSESNRSSACNKVTVNEAAKTSLLGVDSSADRSIRSLELGMNSRSKTWHDLGFGGGLGKVSA